MPKLEQLIGVIKVVLDAFEAGQVDRVFLAYNHFVNTMTQQATFDQLLPLPPSTTKVAQHHWDYLYEPDAPTVLNHVLTRYIEALVYQAVLENIASEHAARMVAMKAASDNATKLIGTLNLIYNKARQGRDHPGNLGDRRRRRGGLTSAERVIRARIQRIDLPRKRSMIAQVTPSTTGTIVQIIGAVVDVEFPRDAVPRVYDALKVDGTAITLEVQQQLGDGVVRTIALGSTDGLKRGLVANNTGRAIAVPVGAGTLGRIMDVLGRPIDEAGPVQATDHWEIHARRRPTRTSRPAMTCSKPASRSST